MERWDESGNSTRSYIGEVGCRFRYNWYTSTLVSFQVRSQAVYHKVDQENPDNRFGGCRSIF